MPTQKSNSKILAAGAGLIAAGLIARRLSGFHFRGKTVLLTGGSRGLGLVLARHLARRGARLAILARNLEALARARTELATLGTKVLALPCDVTDKGQIDQAVQIARRHFGRIDVLINNAGTIHVGPMEVMTMQDYEDGMKTHFWAPLYTILAVLPEFRQRREGRIINIASIGGKIAVPHMLPYTASKFALVGLSEGLSAELARFGIRVTTVIPGMMRTGSPRHAHFKGRHREEYAWFSIGDSLPLLSVGADRAARHILDACARGEPEVILSLPAQLAVRFQGVFPALTTSILAKVNAILPEAGGVGTLRMKGSESESWLTRSWLTVLTERAARRYNQLAAA